MLAVASWTLATLKIVTAPVPIVFSLAYGVPLALIHLPPYFLWAALVRRGRDGLAILAFASATALLEWVQAELTPLGVWGATHPSQVPAAQMPTLYATLGNLVLVPLAVLLLWSVLGLIPLQRSEAARAVQAFTG